MNTFQRYDHACTSSTPCQLLYTVPENDMVSYISPVEKCILKPYENAMNYTPRVNEYNRISQRNMVLSHERAYYNIWGSRFYKRFTNSSHVNQRQKPTRINLFKPQHVLNHRLSITTQIQNSWPLVRILQSVLISHYRLSKPFLRNTLLFDLQNRAGEHKLR